MLPADAGAAQTRLAQPLVAQSGTVLVDLGPGCPPGDTNCGFKSGMSVVVFDDSGSYDTFTVTAVDAARRKVTLTTPDGSSSTMKAAKGVDLGAFTVGEQIAVQVSEATALEIRDDGTPAADAVAVDLAAASDGKAGAVFEGAAVESSARGVAVDAQSRKVTFRFADGSSKSLKVDKDALSAVAVGDTVIVQYAESMIVATSAR